MGAVPVPTPQEILGLTAAEADRLLDRLEGAVPRHPACLQLEAADATEAIVFGDTHGDWRSTAEVARLFRADGLPRLLVGLGDYVDRCPPDCPIGSVANALFLLSLVADAPQRVVLLQGNHELDRRVPVAPRSLDQELARLWGPDPERLRRLVELLERGPFAAVSANGAYLAHAGFPRALVLPRWTDSIDEARSDDARLCEIVWAECDAAGSRRGAAPVWRSGDLERFLGATGLRLMLRGHDPDLCGRPLYGGRCLTLQTTRFYERFGGVVVARLPLREPAPRAEEIALTHLPSEGRSFSPSVR
jgi:hypothetical protein